MFNVVCIALALLQRQHMVHEIYSKTLPANAKPSSVPAPLKGMKVISAGEYLIEEQNVMWLYRYSFKGDMEEFADAAMHQLKGWRKDVMADNVGRPQPGTGFSLTGPVISGRIRQQTMMVTKGRFVADRKARYGSRKEMTPGWISVSLNETSAKAPGK